ncbi:hypothetical protein VE01_01047 [Pseudogymnoascus verrucosus]|uniref:aldehyde dehydrogenase (NAD(+)) n=1 Tax=Pseudogymnoascus verrucosus TaxID=342668 RepID=A0A1B8GXG7_9PEZI|nr:uncharacterized protein VE01_01047 [Pseudogymnoascus verrucosus]OBU00528.1 hypothetical protein VE01_01047 [Pseudogymnoascus verrucosus]
MANAVELTAPNGVKYSQPTGLFINNNFVPAQSGQTLETISPSDEKVITNVACANADDIDVAVEAARAALKSLEWKGISTSARGLLLFRLADLVERDRAILATIDAWDVGKPYTVAFEEDLGEVIQVFRYYAGFADKQFGQTIDTTPEKFAYTRHEPIGVCGQIIPWNYPVMMAAWKLGPALACGNTVVLKAAEQTPLSVLYLASLIKEAGFPAGVVNIVNGLGRVAGAAMTGHLGIDKIAFTGSTVAGREIMKASAINLKSITLETGGKSPLIVFDDAELDQAIKWTHVGIMSNMGQVCTSTSRVYVQESVYSKFVDGLKDYVQTATVIGDPFAEKTSHGPQVSKIQFDKILKYIEIGKSEGATLVAGGKRHGEKGFFIEPTIFSDSNDSMTIAREEVFGPFVVISPFKTEEEAVTRANDTQYGLGAAVFTQNIAKAHRVSAEIEAGMVWINSSNDSHYGIPFGGYKQSGIGRELGSYALSAYSQVKAVHVNLGVRL